MPPPTDRQRRSCYINFAEHLLNAFNPNMSYPDLPHRWSDADWSAFIDMIADFGFNTFEFWLPPRLFSRKGLSEPFGREFARQMRHVIAHGRTRGVGIKMLVCMTTVGDDWHTHCPNIKEEWNEVLELWEGWLRALPGLGVVCIFTGDPGGCSRNGCTARTFIDSALVVATLSHRIQPQAGIELATWGPPFWGWGTLAGKDDWRGEFVPAMQGTGWTFTKARSDDAMEYLIQRLPQFPPNTSVAINLGFNPDGNPDGVAPGTPGHPDHPANKPGEQDARPWARRIAKTNQIVTWDFSLTEGENAIVPHYRFDRLFAQRKREREAAPYSGGICFTMTPMLNQLSLYESAQSFLNPDADHRDLARRFYTRLFGGRAAPLAELVTLFEVVPDWGNYQVIDLTRAQLHQKMNQGAALLRELQSSVNHSVPFHPTPEQHRRDLLFFFELFADLTAPHPDYAALRKRYWDRVYAIYDKLPQHVDTRPTWAVNNLVGIFDASSDASKRGPTPGKWVE